MTAVKVRQEARRAASAVMRVSIIMSLTLAPTMDWMKKTSAPRTDSSKRA